ncbi:hypothetical protein BC829DRAFT_448086 [Chytridium lagenaria]|nr:hypothetical protein BC829DRAFT_448086 [Chytridium lagenaria]
MQAISRPVLRRCICSTPVAWMPRMRRAIGDGEEPEKDSTPSKITEVVRDHPDVGRPHQCNDTQPTSPPSEAETRPNIVVDARHQPNRNSNELETPIIDQLELPPLATYDSTPPRRRFNLSKLKFLSGWEKLDILHSFLSSNYLEESIITYRLLHRNHLLSRVKYQDHHTLLRLLLSDPVEWRDDILVVWREGLRGVGYKPSAKAYGAMVGCALRWGDRRFAEELWREMRAENVEVGVQRDLDVAKEVWDAMEFEGGDKYFTEEAKSVEDDHPTPATFIRGMELHARLLDAPTILSIHRASIKCSLSSPMTNPPPPVVVDRDTVVPGREGTKWLNVVMKACLAYAPTDIRGAVSLAEDAWKEAWRRRVDMDGVSYGRMVVLRGRDRIGDGSGKVMKLRISLLQAYAEFGRRGGDMVDIKEVAGKARRLMETMMREAEEVGKRPLRSSFVFAMEACNFGGDDEGARRFAVELRKEATAAPMGSTI